MDNKITTEFEKITLEQEAEAAWCEETTLVYSEETSRLVKHLAKNPGLFVDNSEAGKVFFELLETSIDEDRYAVDGFELTFSEPVEG